MMIQNHTISYSQYHNYVYGLLHSLKILTMIHNNLCAKLMIHNRKKDLIFCSSLYTLYVTQSVNVNIVRLLRPTHAVILIVRVYGYIPQTYK